MVDSLMTKANSAINIIRNGNENKIERLQYINQLRSNFSNPVYRSGHQVQKKISGNQNKAKKIQAK